MTTLPPNPGLSGLAAREADAELRGAFVLGAGPHDRITVGVVTAERLTTPADIARAADDDADHKRSDFTRPPRPVCGCCGPQRCCCTCHKEDQ